MTERAHAIEFWLGGLLAGGTALAFVIALVISFNDGHQRYLHGRSGSGSWVKQIKIDHPNPRGDTTFLCQTDDCTNLEQYIGMRSLFVYKGWEGIARGEYIGKFIVTGHLK